MTIYLFGSYTGINVAGLQVSASVDAASYRLAAGKSTQIYHNGTPSVCYWQRS